MSIPNIIHMVWVGSPLPSWARRVFDLWVELNPRWQVVLHGRESLHPMLADLYSTLQYPCQQADLLRLSALYEHGGWYVDIDFWPLRSLDGAQELLGLDGNRLMVSRQWGHKSGDALPFANAPLACAPRCPAVLRLMEQAAATTVAHRCDLGPSLIKQAVEQRPMDFQLIASGWFFPLSIADIKRGATSLLFAGRPDLLRLRNDRSAGAMPYAAHLWNGAVDMAGINCPAVSPVDDRPLAIVQNATPQCMDGIAKGLEALGFLVERHDTTATIGGAHRVAVIACWNGLRDMTWQQAAANHDCPLLRAEHGFFDRAHHFQFDHAGFLHNASWAQSDQPSAARCPYFSHVRARTDGPLLFLGQVAGDTQLRDSEVQGAPQAVKAIQKAVPGGLELVYRPHPQQVRHAQLNPGLFRGWQVQHADLSEADEYRKNKHGLGLAASLAACRFAVAINSNALVEATLAGIPCLAFGPAIGIYQGVYRQATLATLRDDIQAMIDGWAPDHESVERFLALLASRQWSSDDLADPAVLGPLVAAAGVELPQLEAAA